MDAKDFTEALERFFLDIVGTITPGFTLIFGYCLITNLDLGVVITGFEKLGVPSWVIMIGLAYVLGHFLTAFSYQITVKWIEWIAARRIGAKILPFVNSEKRIGEKLSVSPIYQAFRSAVALRLPSIGAVTNSEGDIRAWRSLAISLAQKESQLVYRFTFISLLNLCIASAIFLIVAIWLLLLGSESVGSSVSVVPWNLGMVVAMFAFFLFLERYYAFNRRSLQIPFSIALVKIEEELAKERLGESGGARICSFSRENSVRSVYLAGGFRSAWQERVKKEVSSLRFFDPRSHGLSDASEYTAWDLTAIRKSDCVFAYFEAENPAGYALALEIGFAKAMGRLIIFVDEKSKQGGDINRHLEMLRSSADVVCDSLEGGIAFLERYCEVL